MAVILRSLLLMLLLLMAEGATFAQEAGESVVRRGLFADDLYLAGRQVDLEGEFKGDVTVAGQRVRIAGSVAGDVLAAGEWLDLSAAMADDARVAGREVWVNGPVAGDLLAAGETVSVAAGTTVGGRAWLAGARVEMAGNVGRELRAAGETVVVSGRVAGDAEIVAQQIEIRDGAEITGDLIYRGPAPRIDPGAKIGGQVVSRPLPEMAKPSPASAGASVLFTLGLLVAGTVYVLVLPGFAGGAAGAVVRTPLQSLGLGLALLVTVPVAGFILLITVVGYLLALALMALYGVLLLLGGLTGALTLGGSLLRRLWKAAQDAPRWRVAAVALGVVVLALVALLPFLGGLLVFLVLCAGLGGVGQEGWRRYAAAKG